MRTLNFKIATTVIAVFLLVMGALLYVNAKETKVDTQKVAYQWFVFEGSSPSEQGDASNYSPYEDEGEPSECVGSGMYCAILAVPDANNPNLPDLSTIDHSRTKEQVAP